MAKPKVAILVTDGTNCDEELFYAFRKYGGDPENVHVNELRDKSQNLKNYQILALPGGFAYGDDVASGKILAVEIISFLKDQLKDYINKEGLVLGVCNGFQVLVRTGLLPFGNLGKMDATLVQNEGSHFECRFVKIKIEKSQAKFLDPFVGKTLDIAVNHGEGRFFAQPQNLAKIEKQALVFCRYVDEEGKKTQKYPDNPSGSQNAIAGVCDPSGKILGLMPHPEKIVDYTQHPNWRRIMIEKGSSALRSLGTGRFIFEGMIKFAKQS